MKVLRQIYENWRQHRVPRLSAGLAYYTMFSLAPVLVLLAAGVSAVLGESDVMVRLYARIEAVYGSRAGGIVRSLVDGVRRPGASAVPAAASAVVILYGATRVFAHLQDAFNVIWEVETKTRPTIFVRLRRRFAAFATTLAAGLLLLVVVAVLPSVQAVLPFIRDVPGADIVGPATDVAAAWLVMAFAFSLIYKVLPNVRVLWSDVVLGGLAAALAFLVAQSVMVWYLKSMAGSVYGAAGSFIVILFWFYISGQILLLGAEVSKMYTVSRGSHAVLAKALAQDAVSAGGGRRGDGTTEDGNPAGC